MKISFLEAEVALTKTYTATEKTPYPNAYNFKSHTHTIQTIEEFHSHLCNHAHKGHALLKGQLNRDLNWESRAGSTNPVDKTKYICLDVDGLKQVQTVHAFLTQLNSHHIDHIVQYSSSYLMKGDTTLRAHVFMLLSDYVPTTMLKVWLKHLNLTLFRNEISLTASDVALRWPLDVTTGQSDKLLYITPPICTPASLCAFQGHRIQLLKGTQRTMDVSQILSASITHVDQDEKQLVNDLRKQKGLPTRTAAQFKLKTVSGITYAKAPDTAIVTDSKTERGFTYLNLNGGDSWGYYHPDGNPEFIYNFKGEPTYKTEEFLPSYLTAIKAQKRATAQQAHGSKQFLAFQERRTAEYYCGWYDPHAPLDRLSIHTVRNEKQLNNFLASYGQPKLDDVPIWDIVYDPSAPTLDATKCKLNIFKPSLYMVYAEQYRGIPNLRNLQYQPFPTIERIIRNALGADKDPTVYDHFINWLAVLFQHLTITQTAWILHGTQGTGKGLLFNFVLKPLLGADNVSMKPMESLEDAFFSSILENKLLVVIDEIQVSTSRRHRTIMSSLKNMISEHTINVRRMRTNPYDVKNFCNMLFYSNEIDPVTVDKEDRRFNVACYQSRRLDVTDKELEIDLPRELYDFTKALLAYPADQSLARTPLVNEAKVDMQHASRTSTDAIAQALLEGDMDEFWASMPAKAPTNSEFVARPLLATYMDLIADLLRHRRTRFTRDELYVLFAFNLGKNVPDSPTKFTQYLKHHKINIKPLRFGDRLARGFEIESWQQDDDWFKERLADLRGKPYLKLIQNPPVPTRKGDTAPDSTDGDDRAAQDPE